MKYLRNNTRESLYIQLYTFVYFTFIVSSFAGSIPGVAGDGGFSLLDVQDSVMLGIKPKLFACKTCTTSLLEYVSGSKDEF